MALSRCKQGTRSFRAFYEDWSRLCSESGELAGDEHNKIAMLQDAIHPALQRITVGPTMQMKAFEDVVNLVRGVADKEEPRGLYGNKGGNNNNNGGSNGNKGSYFKQQASSQGNKDPDAMDWQPTVNASQYHGKRAKWVDPATINARREARQCVRCGGTGHYIKSCPLLPAQRPKINNASANRGFVVPADSIEDSTESGKEEL